MDLQDQIIVTDWHPQRDVDVGFTLRRLLGDVEGSAYYPLQHGMHTYLWRSAAADRAAASIIITARHHGVYLAARARKPFIAMPSNTRKIEGLIEASGAKIPVVTTANDVEAAVRYAADNLNQYEHFFSWLDSHSPLTTFRVLGFGDSSDSTTELETLQRQVKGKLRGKSASFWGLRNGGAHQIKPT